jgi:hypothetical protein
MYDDYDVPLFHTGPGLSKHQLRCEVNRLTAQLAADHARIKQLQRELSDTLSCLRERDEQLDALATRNFLARIRVLFTGHNARLARELAK